MTSDLENGAILHELKRIAASLEVLTEHLITFGVIATPGGFDYDPNDEGREVPHLVSPPPIYSKGENTVVAKVTRAKGAHVHQITGRGGGGSLLHGGTGQRYEVGATVFVWDRFVQLDATKGWEIIGGGGLFLVDREIEIVEG